MSGLTRPLCRHCASTELRPAYLGASNKVRCSCQTHYECPTCKRPTLTPWEKARGYQCRACTAHDES